MRLQLLFCFLTLLLGAEAFSQDAGTEGPPADSTASHVIADTLQIPVRSFDASTIRELKADPEFSYKIPASVGETLWDRFWAWIGEILSSIFESATGTNWGRVMLYIGGLGLLVALIMLLLKVNAFRVFTSNQGTSEGQEIHGEKIHQMDFDALLQQAVARREYRKGVRLLFLHALKLLSDKQLVTLESGKTNHDYVNELREQDLRNGLNDLSFYFDYAWYGNFSITEETFRKAHAVFELWKSKVR